MTYSNKEDPFKVSGSTKDPFGRPAAEISNLWPICPKCFEPRPKWLEECFCVSFWKEEAEDVDEG